MRKHLRRLTGIALSLLLLSSCRLPRHQETVVIEPRPFVTNATLLEIDLLGEASACRIRNPWQPEKWLAQYLLLPADTTLLPADSAAALRERYPAYTPLTVPLSRMTLTNGCHVYLMNRLDAMDRIAAMCDAGYANVLELHRRIKAGSIRDAGTATAPNIEMLLAARTDAIWIPPFENAGAGAFERFNVPVIFCADYLEPHPLSRAEWMKFYGRLVSRAHSADSLFLRVKNRYRAISDLVRTDDPKPTVLSEYSTGETWTVPGGRSSTSRLYRDAGGAYQWEDDRHVGSLTLSSEAVLTKAQNSDYWFFTYYDTAHIPMDLFRFHRLNPINAWFKANRGFNIYACNTALHPYFEETPFRPDLWLWSIYRRLHTEIPFGIIIEVGDTLYDPFYYQRVVDPDMFDFPHLQNPGHF